MKHKIGDTVRVRENRDSYNIFNTKIVDITGYLYKTVPVDNKHSLSHFQWTTNRLHYVKNGDILSLVSADQILPDDLFTI